MIRSAAPRRGIILFTSLVIASLMLIWAVAAVYRVNQQAGATRFSFRRSEVYYLAKTGISRALNQMNTDINWVASHPNETNGDKSTPGTSCWGDATGGAGTLMLHCKAVIGTQSEILHVPILEQGPSATNVLSVMPAFGGGPDLIARSTRTSALWTPLPAIPGISKIVSAVLTPRGDVYAIGQAGSSTSLWRYRTGQGWRQMPDIPPGSVLSSLSAGGEERVICRGGDNTMLVLPLSSVSDALEWTEVEAPTGTTLTRVAAHPQGKQWDYACVADAGGQTGVYQYDHKTDQWTQFPAPSGVTLDAVTGAVLSSGEVVTDFSGGLTVDKNGRIFAASNPANGVPVVYNFTPTAAGATTGAWTPLHAVPGLEWTGTVASNPSGYATRLSNLAIDDELQLWGQVNNPSGKYSMIQMEVKPITP